MKTIEIVEASENDYKAVLSLVCKLLLELEPGSENELTEMNLPHIAKELMTSHKLVAFLAKDKGNAIGVVTLHECAAIYAGGLFGEISEFYVLPGYRSRKVGERLLEAACNKARQRRWKRIEVCSPPAGEWPRTVGFYEANGFVSTGSRMRQLIQ